MPIPNPLALMKGAETTLWVYNESDDPCANPFSNSDWPYLTKIKDLTPSRLTTEPYDGSCLDDEDVNWTTTRQRQKSAGDTSFTLAWMSGEQGQQTLLTRLNEGDIRAYKIRFPNGMVDVSHGWINNIGRAVTAREVTTRTVKVTNVGRPSMARDHSTIAATTGITATPASSSMMKGQSTTLIVAFQPEDATDKSFRTMSVGKIKAAVSVSDIAIIVNGVIANRVNVLVVSGDGELAAVTEVAVTDGQSGESAVSLKVESFEHSGVTVALSELSALQHIEHLILMKQQAEQTESDSNRQVTMEDATGTGALAVVISL